MFKKILLLGLVILLLATDVLSSSKYEADSYYTAAGVYFNTGDYKNSLRSIHLGREIYSEIGDDYGVARCNDFLVKIDEILPPVQKANYYYDIAGDYYLQNTTDIVSYTRAKNFAQLAKDIYQQLGDSNNVLKADDIIKGADEKIRIIKESRSQDAERYYLMARSNFFEKNYLIAKTYALNASALYTMVPDEEGISKAATLLTSINEKLNELKQDAIASYDKALDYYTVKDYKNAYYYANASYWLYTATGDMDGISKAKNLVSKINEEAAQTEEEKKRLAQKYINSAEEFLVIKDYEKATEAATNAKNIYSELYAEYYEIEHTLPESLRVNMKFYQNLIWDTDNLIKRISDAEGDAGRKKRAEEYYVKAQEYLIKNEITNALTYANKARSLFFDLKLYVGVSKTDSLIRQINERSKQRQIAEGYYNQSKYSYMIADFENARIQAESSRSIYASMFDINKTNDVDALISLIAEGVKKRDAANNYFNSAKTYFDSKNYESAKEYSKKAYDIYLVINHSVGISESKVLLDKSEEILYTEYYRFRNMAILAVVILIVGGIYLYRRSKKIEVEEIEQVKKERDDEEFKRRQAEEWTLRREAEVKEKVEEELRMLIEKEREAAGLAKETEKKPEEKK